MDELKKLIALEKEAIEFGFDWPDYEMILGQAMSECAEIKDAIENKTSKDVQEEIGDLLHSAIALCNFKGYDIEETIAITVKKFSARINALKEIAKERSLPNLHNQSTEFLLELWQEAKKRAKSKPL